MTKKQFLRAAVFTLLALLLLGGLSSMFYDKDNALNGLYGDKKNSLDVIVVGGSHVNSGIIPAVLWQDFGISARNVYGWDQTMWVGYTFIKEAFRTQCPKVVVLDLYGMMYANSAEPPVSVDKNNYNNSYNIRPGLNRLELMTSALFVGADRRTPGELSSLAQYHARWKGLKKKHFTREKAGSLLNHTRGYSMLTKTEPHTRTPWDESAGAAAPYPGCVTYLDKIVSYVEKQGAALVFTMLPYECQPGEPAIYNWLTQYADAHGIPFLNYCGPLAEEAGLDYARDLADYEHLNIGGARTVTYALGNYLSSSFSFTPGDNPARETLDADAAIAMRMLAVNELPGTLDEFLAWCRENGSCRLLISAAKTTLVSDDIRALLEGLGLTGIAAGENYEAIWNDGVLELENRGDAAEKLTFPLDTHNMVLDGVGDICADDKQLCQGSGVQLVLYDTLLKKPVFHTDVNPQTGALNWIDCYVQ